MNKKIYFDWVPLWAYTDMDVASNFMMLVVFRLLSAMFKTNNKVHPDEYWQVTQVAYNWVYGDVELPWEFNEKYKLRNVLYPAYVATPLYLLKIVGLDSGFAVRLTPYLA